MNSEETMSLSDGFLVALLASVPLWATAVFPNTSRPVSNICLAVSGLAIFNWVVLPVGRRLWRRLRASASRPLMAVRYPGTR
jgi:hypothetical protein